jgi:hypothetical protein
LRVRAGLPVLLVREVGGAAVVAGDSDVDRSKSGNDVLQGVDVTPAPGIATVRRSVGWWAP